MPDIIHLQGVRAFGYHGVLEHEKIDGQEFIVDVKIHTRFDDAVRSDDVSQTINYADVAQDVVSSVTNERFDLIETLADHIGRKVLARSGVDRVFVTVHKPHAPIEATFANVSVTRELP
jgi:dihydroneopterin aldolase